MLYLILILAIVCPALSFGETDELQPEAEFMTREGTADFESVEQLLSKPKKISQDISSWRQNGFKVIRSETDVHAIYPHPVEYFVEEILNFENTENIFPRVVDAKVESASDDPFGLHRLWVHTDIKVLSFGAEYVYVTNNWMERTENGYLQKYNLDRCPDGTLYQLIGSWYVEEIDYEGKPHTYIRNFSVVGIRKGSVPMEVAIRAFGMWQLRQLFGNLNKAVEKRAIAHRP